MNVKRVIKVDTFLQIFNLYDAGYGGMKECIKIAGYSYDRSYIFSKYRAYKKHGIEALQPREIYNNYSVSFKLKVVDDYLNGEGSFRTLALKYRIDSFDTIRKWVNIYTSGKEFKAYNPKPEVYKMNINKLTHEDRIKITKECINNGLNYKDIAAKYNVNYNQVYRWVKKYEKHGEVGLIDGRGKGKPAKVMTQEEELKERIKMLEKRNKYLEMENDVLKKLEEIERKSITQGLNKKRRT